MTLDRLIEYSLSMSSAFLGLRIGFFVDVVSSILLRRVVPALVVLATIIVLGSPAVRADDRVYDGAKSVKPLSPGKKIPAAVVQTILGKPIDLETAIGDGGALLVFYRGGW